MKYSYLYVFCNFLRVLPADGVFGGFGFFWRGWGEVGWFWFGCWVFFVVVYKLVQDIRKISKMHLHSRQQNQKF